MLSCHCNHLKTVKCNLYLKSRAHNTKSSAPKNKYSAHAGIVRMSVPQHMCQSNQSIGVANTFSPTARTCKLLTGSSTQLWSACALWAPLLRCYPCPQPKAPLGLTQITNVGLPVTQTLCMLHKSNIKSIFSQIGGWENVINKLGNRVPCSVFRARV